VQPSPVCGQKPDFGLSTFQAFVNGEVPIKEAVVCRKMFNTTGVLRNEEWWRFGLQQGTWYVQRLTPDSTTPTILIARPNDTVCGASFATLWTVSDRNIDIADKDVALGSKPDTFGEFPRSLMFYALSLGLPRNFEMRTTRDSPIHWDGPKFTTSVVNKRDRYGAALAPALITGKLILGDEGVPYSVDYSGVGTFGGGSVAYEYGQTNSGIPSIFVVKYPGKVFRCQFLSLKVGTNEK
jgi:hypothetical protein